MTANTVFKLLLWFFLIVGLLYGIAAVYTGITTGQWAWAEIGLALLITYLIYSENSKTRKTNRGEAE